MALFYIFTGGLIMNMYGKRTLACVLAATVVISQLAVTGEASAAKKIKLNTSKVSLKVGDKTVIKLKNGNKKAKVTWKTSSKAVAKIAKKTTAGNKASATIVAVKKGSAKIIASYKLGKKTKKYTATVKVSDSLESQTTATIAPTAVPTATQASAATTQPTTVAPATNVPSAPTAVPATQEPTAVPTPKIIKASEAEITKEIPSDFSAKLSDVTYGTYKKISYPSKVTNSNREADVFLPADYDESKTYPILYMLHGIGAGGWRFGDGNGSLAKMSANAIAAGICPEMIVVAPNMRCSDLAEGDNITEEEQGVTGYKTHSKENYALYDLFIDDIRTGLMPYMEENYSIKTGRENTALAGFSMGGRESLYIGISHPELFGYIGAFCPAFGIFEYYNNDVKMGEDGLFASYKDFTLSDEFKDNTFIEIVKGAQDGVVHDEPVKYHTALEENGVDHIYYETQGGHDESVWGHGYYNFLCNVFK